MHETTHQHTYTSTHQHTNTPTHQHPVGMGQHFQFGLGGCPVHTIITQQPQTNTPTHQHNNTTTPTHQHPVGMCNTLSLGWVDAPCILASHNNHTPTHQHPVGMGNTFSLGWVDAPCTLASHNNHTPTPGRHGATLSVWAGWKAQACWDTHPHLSTYTNNTTTCETSNHTTAIQQPNTDTPRTLSIRITPFSLV